MFEDAVLQNIFYIVWTVEHYVGNIFVFALNGTKTACAVMHLVLCTTLPLQIGESDYEKLEAVRDGFGGLCVMDSAFSNVPYPFLVKSSRDLLESSDGDSEVLMQMRQAIYSTRKRLNALFGLFKDRV